jgi:DNA-binding transcriptional MerR regulator
MTKTALSGLEDLIKASEAARLLGVHPRTLAKWSDSGVLPEPVRIGPGRFRYYRLSDIEALAHEGAAQ